MLREDIITGNTFRNICDDYIDEDKTHISITNKPKIIFLKTDWVNIFIEKILPKIDYTFKLITHNADTPVTAYNLDLLNDNRLIKWYGMNCHIQHEKLQPIPIGIANEKWPHGNKDELLEVVDSNKLKINLLYSNFDINTNINERTAVNDTIKNIPGIHIEASKLSYKSYLQKLASYKFVISPPGNSVDCHRIWESIYVNTVPIVLKSVPMIYFKDLPILFINKWEDLYSIDLNERYNEIIKKTKNKSLLSYYKNLIIN